MTNSVPNPTPTPIPAETQHIHDAPDATQAVAQDAPARLTRRALFDLHLEEMRQRGEPTEDMMRFAPTPSITTEATDERRARIAALMDAYMDAHGVTSETSEMKAHGVTSETSEMKAQNARSNELLDSSTEVRELERKREWERERERNREQMWREWDNPLSCVPSLHYTSAPNSRAPHDQARSSEPPQRSWDVPCTEPSDDAWDGSNWRHSTEFRLLRDDMLEAAKLRPESRDLYRTFEMTAFAGEADDDKIDHGDGPTASDPAVPADFPQYRAVHGMVELGTYLAASSYIVSLGGPPLPDLKYGIVVVPAGEESLLFAGYGEHAAMSAELKDQVHEVSKAVKMEQEMDLRRKIAKELANGGADSEPELDDDDREFYRQRWLARTGRVAKPSSDGGDMPYASDVDDARGEDDGHGLLQDNGDPSRHEATASAHGHPNPSQVTPAPAAQRDKTSNSAGISGEHVQLWSACPVQKAPSLRSSGTRTSGREADVHHSSEPEVHPGEASTEALSTPSTLDNTSIQGPLSPEACWALEHLLCGEKKRMGSRRVLNSLLSNSKLKNSADPAIARKAVLLQVSRAIADLANGEMCTNPGIDRWVWDAARKDLGLKQTP